MKSIKTLSFAFLGIILSAFFAACGDSNSASTDQHEHFEVEGWNLYWGDWQLAYSVYRGKADSSIEVMHVNANCMSEHIHVKFLDDNKKEVEPRRTTNSPSPGKLKTKKFWMYIPAAAGVST